MPDVDVVPANTIDNNLFVTTDLKKYRRVRNCKPPFQVLLKHLRTSDHAHDVCIFTWCMNKPKSTNNASVDGMNLYLNLGL